MKLQNNLENKAKFFALYWGVKCLKNILLNPDIPSHKVEIGNCKGLPQQFLELTHLSDITDEDASKIGFINGGDFRFYFENWGAEKMVDHFSIQRIDFLRSKSYALPYMGLSVDKLIEYGWVKLKTLKEQFGTAPEEALKFIMPEFDSPKNFPEDYPGENGNYICKCCKCKENFYGYKRRVICKECQEVETSEEVVQVENILKYLANRNNELAEKPCFENMCRMIEINRVTQMIKSNQ